MYETGDSNLRIGLIFLLVCIAIIGSACAENEVYPVYDNKTVISSGSQVNEQTEAMNSPEYLKAQWEITNFTNNEITTFWIKNYRAPDITLSNLIITNHDTGENIMFTYSRKTTFKGEETNSFWNLFGILNPESNLSKEETCQITYSGAIKNLDVTYDTITKTYWG